MERLKHLKNFSGKFGQSQNRTKTREHTINIIRNLLTKKNCKVNVFPCCAHVPSGCPGSIPHKSYFICFHWSLFLPLLHPMCRVSFLGKTPTSSTSSVFSRAQCILTLVVSHDPGFTAPRDEFPGPEIFSVSSHPGKRQLL